MSDKPSSPLIGKDTVESRDEVDQQPFLARWSQRKQAPQAPAVVDAPPPVADREAAEQLPAAASDAAEEPPLPDVDSLDENSDYSGFLSPKVSEKLQRLALRKLFMSDLFKLRDGLDDYDDDFTHFEPLGDIVTADMKHQAELELAREQLRQASQSEPSVADAGMQSTAASTADSRPAAVVGDAAEPIGGGAPDPAAQAEAAPDRQADALARDTGGAHAATPLAPHHDPESKPS